MNRIERLFESNRPTRIHGGWRLMSICTVVALGGVFVGMPTSLASTFAQSGDDRMTAKDAKDGSKTDLDRRQARIEQRLDRLAESLKGRVESGELTSEEAEAEYDTAKKSMMRRVRAAENRGAAAPSRKAAVDLVALKSSIEKRLEELSETLGKQVDAGELSEADAKAKFAEAEKTMWARYRAAEQGGAAREGDRTRVDLKALKTQIESRLEKLGASLKKQVAAGEISAEEGERRFKEAETSLWSRYRKAEMAQTNADDADGLAMLRARGRDRLRVFADQLQERVESGDLTVEEAEAELEIATKKVQRRLRAAYAEAMGGADETRRDATAEGEGELAALKAGIEARLRKMGEELRRQVAAGELTAEDARAKFEAAEKRMWTRYRAAESKERED